MVVMDGMMMIMGPSPLTGAITGRSQMSVEFIAVSVQ